MIAIAVASASETSLSTFGFNLAFVVGLVAGFILGILGSYIGNYFWEKHKEKKWGGGPYLTVTTSGSKIQFQGQLPYTAANQNAIFRTFQRFGWSQTSLMESKPNTWIVVVIFIGIVIILGIIIWRYFV